MIIKTIMMDYRSQLFVVGIYNGVSNNYGKQVATMAFCKRYMTSLIYNIQTQ